MKTWIVDSFTETPFAGNPAGVCLVEGDLDETRMLQIAQELNLSETAFVSADGSSGRHGIRFFSPKMEIPLCGHATLAAARVVLDVHGSEHVAFETAAGLVLTVSSREGALEMDLPAYDTRPAEAPAALLAALGIESVLNSAVNDETRILLLELSNVHEVAGLAPDFQALLKSHDSINGVLVTARSGSDGFDFHSRYFWPWSGTNEDPVTGGTHTFLAGYWAQRLGRTRLRSYQSSARSGSMQLELTGSTVRIRAQAVLVFEGLLKVAGPGRAQRKMI